MPQEGLNRFSKAQEGFRIPKCLRRFNKVPEGSRRIQKNPKGSRRVKKAK